MKFPRNAHIFEGRLDAAPFAAVFFLLVIFMMVGSLVYTPGVRLQLPFGHDLPGLDKPSVAVAMDKEGRLYFKNQGIAEGELRERLSELVRSSSQPLTLLVQADKEVTNEMIVRLTSLAREAGISEAFLATLPRPFVEPVPPPGK